MSINIYTVQNDVESSGWKLISTEYKNLKTPLEFICPKGHQVSQPYGEWRKHRACLECQKNTHIQRNKFPPKKSGDFRVIALDASTGITGYSIYDNRKLIAYGTFSAYGETEQRINQVKQWMDMIYEVCEPDAIGVEDIQCQKNIKMFQVLANLQGVIKDWLFEHKEYLNCKFAYSSTWRSFVGINKGDERETAKKQAQNYVNMLYGINATQDEADAICMGYYFAYQFKSNKTVSWGEDIL